MKTKRISRYRKTGEIITENTTVTTTEKKPDKSATPRFTPLIQIAAVVFWLALWQLGASAVGTEVLLPSPLQVIRRLFYLIREEDFLLSVAYSMCRIMAGYLLAVIIGCAVGGLCEKSRAAQILLSPVLSVITSTPVASVIILTLVWIGRDLVPSFIVMLIVIPVVAAHTRAGLGGISPELVSLCKIYSLPRMTVIRKLYLPSMLPDISAGLSTALGLAWKSGVAAEVLAVPLHSIGAHVYQSKLYLETTDLFAWTVTVVLLSMLISKLLCAVIKKPGERARYAREAAGNGYVSNTDAEAEGYGTVPNGDGGAICGTSATTGHTIGAESTPYTAGTAETLCAKEAFGVKETDCDKRAIGEKDKHGKAGQTEPAYNPRAGADTGLSSDIALRGIEKSYNGRYVLHGLNLTVSAHGVTALTGASGIGKSTVAAILCGETKPDGGTVLGLEPEMCAPVFQEHRLLPWHSALENCALCSHLGRKRHSEAIREASELLSLLGIDEKEQSKTPPQLSGGMNQRVAIARALISHRPFLVLDEPFRGLDPETKRRVMDLVDLRADTVLLITHSREEAEYMGAKIYRLEELMS